MMELAETKQSPRREAKTARWRDPPSWRSFAAAMAATVVATLGLQHLIAAGNAPDAALQAIVSAHMRSQISGQPVDVVSTDRHTVKPWLAGKLPVAAEVVDLAEAGFPLAGGRIDIVARRGRPDARLQAPRPSYFRDRAARRGRAKRRSRAISRWKVIRWSAGRTTSALTWRFRISRRPNSTHLSRRSGGRRRRSEAAGEGSGRGSEGGRRRPRNRNASSFATECVRMRKSQIALTARRGRRAEVS